MSEITRTHLNNRVSMDQTTLLPDESQPVLIAKDQRRGQTGQSLIELAVSFTILLLLLGVLVDAGRLFFTFIAIREAAEEAALYGSTLSTRDAGTTAAIIARLKDSSTTPIEISNGVLLSDIENSDITVSYAPGGKSIGEICSGDTITVRVEYLFQSSMPLSSGIIPFVTIDYPVTNQVLVPLCD